MQGGGEANNPIERETSRVFSIISASRGHGLVLRDWHKVPLQQEKKCSRRLWNLQPLVWVVMIGFRGRFRTSNQRPHLVAGVALYYMMV
jgi:hypothetical protein